MSRSHTHIFYLLIGLCFSVNIQGQILDRHLSDLYADKFNQQDKEIYIQSISNKQAKDFLAENIPFFECPDKDIEEIYYFRWWTYRKHIKETPEGFIITEFLPDVSCLNVTFVLSVFISVELPMYRFTQIASLEVP